MSNEDLPTRRQTVRDAIYFALRGGLLTLHELSAEVGASEKDLPDDLQHLQRSLENTGERLVVTPARCIACGFAFDGRTRLSKPGRCPRCRATRIAPARFRIE